MPTRRYFSNFAPRLTLANSIGSSDVTLTVATNFAGWPTQYPYFALLGSGLSSAEIVKVTGVVGSTATIERGQDGSAAVGHPAGETMDQVAVRLDYDEANAHTSAVDGVHGVSGDVVGTTDAQTLTNKTLTDPVINGVQGDLHPSGSLTVDGDITASSDVTVAGLLTLNSGIALNAEGGFSDSEALGAGFVKVAAAAPGNPTSDVDYYGLTIRDTPYDVNTPAVQIALVADADAPGPAAYLRLDTNSSTDPTWKPLYSDTGWINLPLRSGFSVGSSAPQYRKRNGIVYFQGEIIHTDNSAFTQGTVYTLADVPAGYRPVSQSATEHALTAHGSDGLVRGLVSTAGAVTVVPVTNAPIVISLGGLSGYIAEQ